MSLRLRSFLQPLWLAPLALLAAAPALADPAPGAKEAARNVLGKAPKAHAPLPPAYEPRPAIWLLADEDTKIYLFGTIHILPPGFRWRSPAFERVAAQADELVVETYDPPGEEDHAALAELFMRKDAAPLLARVPEGKRAALKAAVAETGMPMPFLDTLHTWAAAMTLGVAALLGQYEVDDADDAPGVEDVLEVEFREAKKPIVSIEDGLAVLRAMNALPEKEQVALLLEGIEETDEAPAKTEAEDAEDNLLWATGKPERLGGALREALSPALYDLLLRRRNAAWTVWLQERLKKPGTVLVAVGAGHLTGEDSLQTMLAARGLEARRYD
jgi:hypothetical protein